MIIAHHRGRPAIPTTIYTHQERVPVRNPMDEINALYDTDRGDRALFGDAYIGPAHFQHAEWALVARFEAPDHQSVGQTCEIYEMRVPTRFYKIVGVGDDGQPAWVMSTGSGDEMGRLAVAMAKAIADGMLGLREQYCQICRVRVRLAKSSGVA